MKENNIDFQKSTIVDFQNSIEYWNTYQLNDGTTLKLKTVLSEVKRLQQCKPDGSPIYVVTTQIIVRTTNIPDDLMGSIDDRKFKPI